MYSSNRPPLSPLHLNKGGSLSLLFVNLPSRVWRTGRPIGNENGSLGHELVFN